jgi:hypothetical protein
MQEALFQFIWQYSLYRPDGLQTADGIPVTVVHPGSLNRHAGPDFTGARIRIGNTLLIGAVELHVRSSDWAKHGHDSDPAYRNIILHVVHTVDRETAIQGVPTLELGPQIPDYVVNQYTSLLQTPQAIPCAQGHGTVPVLTKESWLSRILAERWEGRLEGWAGRLQALSGDWNRLFYERLAAGFGFKVNAEAFVHLAQITPLHVLLRHRGNLLQLEAMLFGQAGFLEDVFEEEYPVRLQREYRFQQHKYGLQPMAKHQWKFLRMRPANFPTVRIAQFAGLLHQSENLFAALMEVKDAKAAIAFLDIAASSYWEQHVRFGEAQEKSSVKKLGRTSAENLLLNVVAPMRFLVAHHTGSAAGREDALRFLEALPAENNNVLRLWSDSGWQARNAADSQALLELYKSYCTPKRCLECAVGLRLVRSRP